MEWKDWGEKKARYIEMGDPLERRHEFGED